MLVRGFRRPKNPFLTRFSACVDSLKCSKHDKNNEKREKADKVGTMKFVWRSFVQRDLALFNCLTFAYFRNIIQLFC